MTDFPFALLFFGLVFVALGIRFSLKYKALLDDILTRKLWLSGHTESGEPVFHFSTKPEDYFFMSEETLYGQTMNARHRLSAPRPEQQMRFVKLHG